MKKNFAWIIVPMLILSLLFTHYYSTSRTVKPAISSSDAHTPSINSNSDSPSDSSGIREDGNTAADAAAGEDQKSEDMSVNNNAMDKGNSDTTRKNPDLSKSNDVHPAVNNTSDITASRSSGAGSAYPKLSKSMGIYGQFCYKELSGGRIQIEPQWVAKNIVTITLPGLNTRVQVNKNAQSNFIRAFNIIKSGTATIDGRQVPLISLIKTMDGTFVSRHVNWNPANGLSNHSWGVAIDINADNHFGYIDPSADPNDPNLILWEKAFKPAGFSWGNSYGDSMHFELLDQ